MESSAVDLSIRRIRLTDVKVLGSFFEELARDEESTRFFHPHPLTPAYAAELCASARARQDRYYIALFGQHLAAYGMLRGWDEGYAVPSWGGCVHPELRGAGLGHFLLEHAVAECRAAGAATLRLSVYKANQRGIHLYAKFGFMFQDKGEISVVGLLDLSSCAALPRRKPDRVRLQNWYAARAAREAA
jgi:ribosomal protein S18 acetylase RimI-like enzyme